MRVNPPPIELTSDRTLRTSDGQDEGETDAAQEVYSVDETVRESCQRE
jgi:hypothetical protein